MSLKNSSFLFVILFALCFKTSLATAEPDHKSQRTYEHPDVAFHIIIPARYDSKRLPGKMLLDIEGKPLIQYAYEGAVKSKPSSITIATDDERILEAAEKFGAKAIMTSTSHENGSARLAEAIVTLGLAPDDIIVNLQGDEPLIQPEQIWQVVHQLSMDPKATVSTLSAPITHQSEIFDSNIVKIVTNQQGYANYFSRAPIPYPRDGKSPNLNDYKRHVGMYGYRVKALLDYRNHEPVMTEDYEKLEQLRFLWLGLHINVSPIDSVPLDVNTQEDLDRVKSQIQSSKRSQNKSVLFTQP